MKKTVDALIEFFLESHPEEAAHRVEQLPPEEAAQFFDEMPTELVGPVAERLTPHAAGQVMAHLGPERSKVFLSEMPLKDAAVILHHLDADAQEAILKIWPEESAPVIRSLMEHSPEAAGGMMDPQVLSLAIDLTAGEAIQKIRSASQEALYYLYVTDRGGRLVGVLTMRDLLLAPEGQPIAPLVREDVLTVSPDMDREELAVLMRERRFVALPVVDVEQRLLGVVTHDQMLDTIGKEAFEDMQKMVGAGGDESSSSPISTMARRRIPWLYVNLVTAFTATVVISLFEGLLSRVTALAVLLPIVSALGGNSGAQALAVMMRGLALREIMPGMAQRLIFKEAIVGLINGICVALAAGLVVYIWFQNPGLSLIMSLAMIVNMIVAGLAGAAIPLVLQALGRDPAQSSQIFLTTVTDVVGFASFLGFALLFFPMLPGA